MNKKIIFAIVMMLLVHSKSVEAWNNHTLITNAALKNVSYLNQAQAVPAETLENFLMKEQKGLQQVLDQNEKWARANLTYYAPLPNTLKFKLSNNQAALKKNFVESIRINPNAKFNLFIQSFVPENIKSENHRTLALDQISLSPELKYSTVTSSFLAVKPGQLVTPIQIISTASDEPDYGIDKDLWENNKTAFGKIYGFGPQPYGNPHTSFGTQVPFHVAFWFESPLLYKLAPAAHQSYAQYRFRTYLRLACFAFKTHHPYWGYRFLGWALHYAQDLSQPYHSTLAPGVNTLKLISLVGLYNLFKIETPGNNLQQRLINRHIASENYVYFDLQNAVSLHDDHNILIKALSQTQMDTKKPKFGPHYLREVIAKESYAASESVDFSVQKLIPSQYIDDPHYIFGVTEPNINLYDMVRKKQSKINNELDIKTAKLFQSMGTYTRNIVKYVVKDHCLTGSSSS